MDVKVSRVYNRMILTLIKRSFFFFMNYLGICKALVSDHRLKAFHSRDQLLCKFLEQMKVFP